MDRKCRKYRLFAISKVKFSKIGEDLLINCHIIKIEGIKMPNKKKLTPHKYNIKT